MTHPTLLILGALSGASLSFPFAYAAPQKQATSEEGTPCACTCAACVAKHGAKATTAATTPGPDAASAEMTAVREALAAVEAKMTAEERVARVLATDLTDVSDLLEDEPILEEDEPTAEDRVAQVLGTELSQVDGLLSSGSFRFESDFDVDLDDKAAIRPAAPVSEDQGYLGVELSEGEDGVEIAGVMAGSPAAESDVQVGDVLFNVAGTTVMDMAGLRGAMARFKPGDTIGFGVMRDGRPVNLTAKLADRKVLAQGTVPEVEEPVAALPSAREAAPAPIRPKRVERIRLLPGGDDADSRTITFSTGEKAQGEDAEVILARPIRLPTRVAEPMETPDAAPRAGRRRIARAPRETRAEREPRAPRPAVEAVDALPEGYVEIMTRRERRPAGTEALQARIEALEAEVAALTAMLAEIRRDLDRRNPR